MRPSRTKTLAITAVLVTIAGCGSPTGADSEGAAAGGGDDRPVLLEPAVPQAVGPDSQLVGCTDGREGVAERVASIVVPSTFGVDAYAFDNLTDRRAGPEEDAGNCAYAKTDYDDVRRRGSDAFSLTVSTEESLREAVERLALRRGAQPIVERATVFAGRRGERARFLSRDSGLGAVWDTVAVQSDGIRLVWQAPRDRSPAQAAAGRALWQQVQDSLAVRSPAAADGDDDAESDPEGPEQPTDELAPVEPTVTAPVAGFRAERCRLGRATIEVMVPDRLMMADRDEVAGSGRPCTFVREVPSFVDPEVLQVVVGERGSLRARYEEEKEFESEGGDDSTYDLEYDNDVPGPGGLRAESLVYGFANDGVPREHHIWQFQGVQVDWTVPRDTWGPQLDELATVLDSLSVTPR